MKRRILQFHHNTRGAIGILVLLTIWCLVSIFAMTWNTAEYGYRRQKIQTAADSAAHAAAMESARAVNAVTGQNMVIAQDAAAQTIWQAVPLVDPQPTVLVSADGSNYPAKSTPQDVKGRLGSELRRATAMLKNANLLKLQNRINQLLVDVQNEHDLAQQAITDLNANLGQANFATAQDATDFTKELRQAQSALNYVDQVYMNGGAPTAGRPGPPGPGGEGLIQLINQWAQKPANETAILNLIISYINSVELPIMQGPDGSAPNGKSFETITKPAVNTPLDQIAQKHEQDVFQSQQDIANAVPAAVEAQRSKLAAFYNVDITLATLQNDGSTSGPAQVAAPVVTADQVDGSLGLSYTDQIRSQYPDAAAAAGLPLTFDIDPVNPQTDIARVWHPDVPFTVPGLPNTFTLDCNAPGGWGHIWAMPIERYYNDRVNNDKRRLGSDYMQYLDNARNNRPSDPRDLAYQIRQLMSLPDKTNIADLPGSISDDQPDEKGVIEKIFVMPQLSDPTGSAKFRTQIDLYNKHGGAYTGAVRSLRAALIAYTYYFDGFTRSFASDAWNSAVEQSRDAVVQQLGTAKTFMVLASYKLQWIPEQLKGGLSDSATLSITDQIIENNRSNVTNAILNAMVTANPDGVGGGILDANTKRNVIRAHYTGLASQQAIAAITPLAQAAAAEIAREWINRPWPYEITPPEDPDLCPAGMSQDDRQQYFTIVAAARQSDASAPKFMLPTIFGTQPKLVAYAQAESFNWMEFNPSYGGTERFDQVSTIPYNYDSGYIPVPRCWRVSTVGGWSWQPRLSLSDALPKALSLNPELQSYLSDAGINSINDSDFTATNLH